MMLYGTHSSVRGFTLIELMISTTILLLLMLTASYSYRIIVDRWDTVLSDFYKEEQVSKGLNIVGSVLEGVHGYIVTNDKNQPKLFFVGQNQSLLSVTSSGIFSENDVEIFRLSFIEQDGKTNIIYQAKNTQVFLLLNTYQEIEFDYEITLFRDLDSAELRYYGWRSSELIGTTDPSWFNDFSGLESDLFPLLIELSFLKDGKAAVIPISLDQNVSKLFSPYIEEQ
ncbi:prepilin-type N-terminal cleavage/methylation domain-containing protein [Thalassotalea euphylliae]|uniref:prepilin-type N-terminal cleavage/methylation domain-containing protein n=1 Tax=Thalassotalea euphylliae TaxID=1655234 RepID=UPI0036299151